jgi:phosphoglucosamine mutase
MSKLFGTDGIRGRVNTHPMDPETALRVGMAAAAVLKKEHGRNMVLIGKDTRLSGYMLECALTSGICSMGMNVTLVGPMPTPGVAFLTKTLRLDAGVVISASHNPYEDNGIKFFGAEGFKLPDRIEEKIERLVADKNFPDKRPSGAGIGRTFRLDDARGRYIEYIKSTIPKGETLEGLKVVVDSANGAAYRITPWVLEELGAQVIRINSAPDGLNINENCGSLHPEVIREAVLEHQAHAGVAHDGDADRTILVDEKGGFVDGDHVMGIWAVELGNSKKLKKNTVVATVMSNLGLERFLEEKGIKMIRTQVGDRYVTEEMLRGGYVLGGEQSGHIVNLYLNTTGDGPITALHILHCMKKTGLALSELRSAIPIYPQVLLNVESRSRPDLSNIPGYGEVIKKAEKELAGEGRILVRPSGTEPKVRVMVEGRRPEVVNSVANTIASFLREKLS